MKGEHTDTTSEHTRKTEYAVRRIKEKIPLINMIERGKDETEAAIPFIVSRILDHINDDFDDPFFSRDFSPEKNAQHRSLRWNAE
jgi:hypothetical protein